jgi:glycosyltransferase involved in cell wall biosynthesis
LLAILVKRFPRLSETFILNEIIELRRQGIPLRVFAVMDPRENRTNPEAEALRPEVHYLREGNSLAEWISTLPAATISAVKRPRGFLRGGGFSLQRRSWNTAKHFLEALELCLELDRVGATHLHAAWAHTPAAIAHLAHMISGIPFSFTAHAKDLYTTPPEYIARRARAASFVVTCTAANAEYLKDLLGRDAAKIVVSPHGVDLDRFGSLPRMAVPGRILSVGRLVPKKGFETLVNAFGLLKAHGVKFEARIFGGGPMRDELERLVESLGMAGQVVVKGARAQVALLNEYSRAEVFALSPMVVSNGDRDGIPNVLGEAMAAGIPVVSTAISGIPELIEHNRTGLLVPPRDPHALAEALEQLLIDEMLRKRLGTEARAQVTASRGLADSVRPLAELFEKQVAAPVDASR